MQTFEALGLSTSIAKTVQALGYETPTPIQSEAIPLVLAGHDLMGLAQTGTGKTAAFGLPLVHHLMSGERSRPAPKNIKALILAPTRELTNQICDHLRGFIRNTPLKVGSVVGGTSINVQIKHLGRGTDILVATPGRLLDLVERRAVFLDSAEFLVLDEADQMLDLGFIHALRKIAKLVGTPRQTLLFSATMPKQIEDLSRAYLNDPVRIEVARSGLAVEKIRQSVHFINQRGKADLLKDCLSKRPDDLSLVFSRTKHGAEKLMKHLRERGFDAGSIHGNKSQGQRDRAIKAFRNGDIRVLVATDVAARGIDIPGVSHVYNYDLPEVPESYVHRIGRTARAGAGGEAVAFCSGTDIRLLRDIEKLMGTKVTVASGEVPEYERPTTGRGSRGRPGGNHGQNQHQRSRKRRAGPGADGGANQDTPPSAGFSKPDRPGNSGQNKPKSANGGNRGRPGNWRGRSKGRAAAA